MTNFTGRSFYYDRQGQPMTMEQWGPLLEDIEGRRVAETTLPNGRWVSTVWMGLDHNFSFRGGPPLIFETMVFSQKEPLGASLDVERYSTEAEAQAGHKALCTKWSDDEATA